jgi:hypothetical protein
MLDKPICIGPRKGDQIEPSPSLNIESRAENVVDQLPQQLAEAAMMEHGQPFI